MKYADGEKIHRLFQALQGTWKEIENVEESVHRSSGLTSAQSKNISHLLKSGPMTISDLAFERGVSRQSVQVAVSTLAESGYIRFEDNPRHKRSKLMHVTELGCSRFSNAQKVEYEILRSAFPDLKNADADAAIRVLQMVRDNLSRLQEPASSESS
jgi:DNA-binding MarR family transcriptional regulator